MKYVITYKLINTEFKKEFIFSEKLALLAWLATLIDRQIYFTVTSC